MLLAARAEVVPSSASEEVGFLVKVDEGFVYFFAYCCGIYLCLSCVASDGEFVGGCRS